MSDLITNKPSIVIPTGTREDRDRLAKAMGFMKAANIRTGELLFLRTNGRTTRFNPFTDASDERDVLHFMREQLFSVRHRFFSWLDYIVQDRLEMKEHASWPGAMIFMQEGDIARAALLAIENE